MANGKTRSAFNAAVKAGLTVSLLAVMVTGALTFWKSHRLTSADPAGRALTSGEVTMAKTVFGETIDYKQVRLHRAPYSGDRALTIGNDIYLETKPLQAPDLSTADTGIKSKQSLIHEMTYVWQGQNRGSGKSFADGLRVLPSRLTYLFTGRASFSKLSPDMTFATANKEQQASMAEFYFAAQEDLRMPACQTKEGGPVKNALCQHARETVESLTPRIRPTLPLPGAK
jgi:hypothetical protein